LQNILWHPLHHFRQSPITRILISPRYGCGCQLARAFQLSRLLENREGTGNTFDQRILHRPLPVCEFLEKRKRLLLTARRTDVRDFLQQLFSNQIDGRSVGRKLSALRHLYRYLLLDKKIEHDPTLDIESPRQWKVLPKALARDEMEATLAAPLSRPGNSAGNTKLAPALAQRDCAMLEVFYAGLCGFRRSSTPSLKISNSRLDTC